jgi:hypothetical protein
MRLPQQRQIMNKCPEHARTSLWRASVAKTFGVRPSLARPAYSTGGTADCIARCRLLPPGPLREECMRDCF